MGDIGIMIYNSGQVYQGEWYDDKRHTVAGIGKLSDGKDIVHNGRWANNNPAEESEFTYPNGDIYSGWHAQGYKHGVGKVIHINHDVFEGLWWRDM